MAQDESWNKPEVYKGYDAWVSVKVDIGCEAASEQREIL